ncbi:MAG: SDR family oxidoreductase [Acetilactobacillus jinshanensis]
MKRVILITGAAKGIGLADAKRLSRNPNNQIVINSHRKLSADEIKKIQNQLARPADLLVGDVSDEKAAQKMVKTVFKKYGHIDVLVNNAGITRDTLIPLMKASDFKAVLDTNLVGTFNMTKAALRYMFKKRHGVIINMSSVSGLHGNLGQANYSASKAGIVGLTKTTAQEGSLRGIRCNAVAPGMIATAMTAKLSDRVARRWKKRIPMHRFGKPDEVAQTVEFLINNQYITGQVITLDGGLTI